MCWAAESLNVWFFEIRKKHEDKRVEGGLSSNFSWGAYCIFVVFWLTLRVWVVRYNMKRQLSNLKPISQVAERLGGIENNTEVF